MAFLEESKNVGKYFSAAQLINRPKMTDPFMDKINEMKKERLPRFRYMDRSQISTLEYDYSQHVQKPIKKHVKQVSVSHIRKSIESQNWKSLLPTMHELITNIRQSTLSSTQIISLISATLPSEQILKKDSTLFEIMQTLHSHLKDIMIFFQIGKKQEALERAQRCLEIVQLTSDLQKIAKEEGLTPINESDLIQVDIIDGKPIFTIK